MKRYISLILAITLPFAVPAWAANYVKPDELKQWLKTGKPVILVDIQPAHEFMQHHFKGSVETNAFPAKRDEEKKKLDKVLPRILASRDDVVIICPRGRSGAMNTYDYLKSKGVDEKRLYILEGGVAGWPYREMLE